MTLLERTCGGTLGKWAQKGAQVLLRPEDSEVCDDECCLVFVLMVDNNNVEGSLQAQEEAQSKCAESLSRIIV